VNLLAPEIVYIYLSIVYVPQLESKFIENTNFEGVVQWYIPRTLNSAWHVIADLKYIRLLSKWMNDDFYFTRNSDGLKVRGP